LTIENDGTLTIFDKRTNKQYSNLLFYLDNGETGDGWGYVAPTQDNCILSTGAACVISQTLNSKNKCTFSIIHKMLVPKEMLYSFDKTGYIRRSNELIEMDITTNVSITDTSPAIFVETIVNNTALDHRLRLSLPTKIENDKYFVSQAFCFVERNCGRDNATDNWCEPETLEKPMSGIVGKRNNDGSGIAFISAYGLHECAALDDKKGTINITLLRAFRNSIGSQDQIDGQVQGKQKYSYCLLPLEEKDTFGTMQQLQDCISTGIKFFNTKCSDDFTPSSKSLVSLSGDKDICVSIIKRPEREVANSIVVRLYNLSSKQESTELKFSRLIEKAEIVNLNEEYICAAKFEGNTLNIELEGNKIATYLVKLI